MHKIVFLDIDATPNFVRRPDIQHEWTQYGETPDAVDIPRRLKEATVAIVNRTPITADTLKQCPHLQFVVVAATGYDLIDVGACEKHGVVVSNIRNWSVSVPEHIFSLILALRRQLLEYRTALTKGRWHECKSYGFLLEPIPLALAGSTLGLVGYGGLAARVEEIARAFGMRVAIAERKDAEEVRTGRLTFEQVVTDSDVLVTLCPLRPETRDVIAAPEFQRMKETAILINCARGGVVNEEALLEALKSGKIAGAGLDVLVDEPPKEHTLLMKESLPNLIVTPHVAWASVESLQVLESQVIENIEAFASGQPKRVVVP